MHVEPQDISVIIQGPTYVGSEAAITIDETIQSVRRVLPGAEVIVSTWQAEARGVEDADQWVEDVLPAPTLDCTGNPNRVAAQILSVQNGLRVATRPFVLKMRADHMLCDRTMVRVLPRTPGGPGALLGRRIRVTSYFTRNPLVAPFLFHPSDVIQFGAREDLLALWGTHPPELSYVVATTRPPLSLFGNHCGPTIFREVPEQTICLQWLRRAGQAASIDHPCETTRAQFQLWERVFAANFAVVDAGRSGVIFPERFHRSFLGSRSLVGEHEFEALAAAPGSPARYARLVLNKYLWTLFHWRYLMVTANVLLTRVAPSAARALRRRLRTMLGVVHRERI